MTSEAVAPDPEDFEPPEPSPFDEDDDAPGKSAPTPWLPAKPLSQDELDYYSKLPFELRMFNPWACMYNRVAEDGIGYYSGVGRIQCDVLLADPTKSRYCLEHARKMGVDYYAPAELAEAVDKETATNLTRLVPKATRVLEEVMDDEDAPQGVRAKAASEILDRTGYVRGVDVRVEAQIATVDITAVISDRLDALRDAHVATETVLRDAAAKAAGAESDDSGGGVNTVAGEIISSSDHDDTADPEAPLP
jgi:hypothetical protein